MDRLEKKMNVNNDAALVSVKKLKKVLVTTAMAGALFSTVISGAVGIAKGAYQNSKGTSYLVSQIEKSGVLPKKIGGRDDSQSGFIFNYEDAYGQIVSVSDSDSFVNDIVATAVDDYGFTPAEMSVVFEYISGNTFENTIGVTGEQIAAAKKAAYYEFKQMENGRSK